MYFGTFIDPVGAWVDSVHFPQSAVQYWLAGHGFYYIRGKVVEEFGVYLYEVAWMRKVSIKQLGFLKKNRLVKKD